MVKRFLSRIKTFFSEDVTFLKRVEQEKAVNVFLENTKLYYEILKIHESLYLEENKKRKPLAFKEYAKMALDKKYYEKMLSKEE